MSESERQEIFEYLDELREIGTVNMYGAAPYVQDKFGLSKKEARTILLEWMENFGK